MFSQLNALERWALLFCGALILLSAGLYGALQTQSLSEAIRGAEFSLQHRSGAVSLADFQGKGVVLMFGYSSCPDVCPSGLARLAAALSRLSKAQQQQLQAIFISVDPERDTLEKLDLYSRYFYPGLLGLTAGKAELDPVVSAYGAFYRRVELPGSALGYSIDHSARFHLIDRSGQQVQTLDHNTPVAALATALQQLLQGNRS